MDGDIRNLVLNALGTAGSPEEDVRVSREITRLIESVEPEELSKTDLASISVWIGTLCNRITNLEAEVDDLHRQRDYEIAIT